MGKYSKAIIAVVGAIVTVVTTLWPHAQWATVVSTVATAVLVYLTPNVNKS